MAKKATKKKTKATSTQRSAKTRENHEAREAREGAENEKKKYGTTLSGWPRVSPQRKLLQQGKIKKVKPYCQVMDDEIIEICSTWVGQCLAKATIKQRLRLWIQAEYPGRRLADFAVLEDIIEAAKQRLKQYRPDRVDVEAIAGQTYDYLQSVLADPHASDARRDKALHMLNQVFRHSNYRDDATTQSPKEKAEAVREMLEKMQGEVPDA